MYLDVALDAEAKDVADAINYPRIQVHGGQMSMALAQFLNSSANLQLCHPNAMNISCLPVSIPAFQLVNDILQILW